MAIGSSIGLLMWKNERFGGCDLMLRKMPPLRASCVNGSVALSTTLECCRNVSSIFLVVVFILWMDNIGPKRSDLMLKRSILNLEVCQKKNFRWRAR